MSAGLGRTRSVALTGLDGALVDVEAHMGSAVVELVAHNRGDWLFHCHKPMHMMGGMVSVVKVG